MASTREPDPAARHIGASIRRARRASRLSQQALGAQISLSRARVHALEQGQVRRFDPALLRRIAEITGQSPDSFYPPVEAVSFQALLEKNHIPVEVQAVLTELLTLPPAHQIRAAQHMASFLSWYRADKLREPTEVV